MSKRLYATITAVSAYLPPDRLTNSDLEKMVDTSDEWIVTRTGIRERRQLRGEGLASSDMAAPVITQLCAERGIALDEVECVIVATTTPDFFFPSTANLACYKAGAKNAWSFDLAAACSGFLYALNTGAALIECGRYKKVMVIGADKMSAITNYKDRNTCILFGDAAAGVLLEPNTEGYGLQDTILRSDGEGKDYLYMKGGGSFMPPTQKSVMEGHHHLFQEGKHVFKRAVQYMSGTCRELLTRNGLTIDEVRYMVPHQANLRIIKTVAEEVGIPLERVTVNIDKYGNTTAATVPLCLWEWRDMFKQGDNLLLSAFGAGFTWGAMWLKWGGYAAGKKS